MNKIRLLMSKLNAVLFYSYAAPLVGTRKKSASIPKADYTYK